MQKTETQLEKDRKKRSETEGQTQKDRERFIVLEVTTVRIVHHSVISDGCEREPKKNRMTIRRRKQESRWHINLGHPFCRQSS